MEASAHEHQPGGTFSLGGVTGHELVLEGRGLDRLAVMVNVVLDRLTAVEDKPPERSAGA
jgi:hypothetical protein